MLYRYKRYKNALSYLLKQRTVIQKDIANTDTHTPKAEKRQQTQKDLTADTRTTDAEIVVSDTQTANRRTDIANTDKQTANIEIDI